MRFALPAMGLLLMLAACGGEPDMPAAPMAEEERVLREAAEMLPDDSPSPEPSASPDAAD